MTALEGDLKSYAASVTEGSSSSGGGSRENRARTTVPTQEGTRRGAQQDRAVAPGGEGCGAAAGEAERGKGLLEKKLAEPGIYAPGKAKDLTYINQRIAAIKRETEAAERDWLAAEAALEAAI